MSSSKKTNRLQRVEVLQGLWKCCQNCEHWDEQQSQCGKFKMVPPPDIILHGCQEHVDECTF